MENQFAAWFSRWTRRSFDPIESRTSMGRIGSLKQSGRIVLRVRPEGGPFPALLRQSTYDALQETSWVSSSRKPNGREFAAVPSEEDLTTWQLTTNLPSPGAVSIFLQFPGKRGLLAAPSGTVQLENLPVGGLETNSVGVMRVTDAPGLLKFRARYGAAARLDLPPQPERDLAVPERERKAITNVLAEINAGALKGEARLVALAGFFQNKFRYETYVPGNARAFSKHDSALSRFLLETRAGHCEYFASATVLILRQMGIPARYTTGFAVQEKSRWSQTYLVRDRHAHAWVTAWVNGAWREFDTTPSSWNAFEEKESSMFEPAVDLWAELLFQLARWRWLGDRELFGRVAPWLIGPLVVLLSWRIFVQRKRSGQADGPGSVTATPAAGADSEFYQIDARLAKLGLARRSHESWTDWLQRVEAADGVVPNAGLLPPLLDLHCRYRFARHGVSVSERAALRQGAETWLADARKAPRLAGATH
jgi:transglutaminase-like putative cysteine protease